MRATKSSWPVRVLAMVMIGGCLTAGTPRDAAAQTIRGTITGTVTDTTGAVLPAITVTVTQLDTGIQTSAQTTTQGRYTIPLLASGTYQATVEQQGFKKHLRTGIVVQIAQTTRLDITLDVGEMNETVEVLAQTAQIRSTTAELGQVIEMKQIQGLPLNGRFFQHLISLTPGAMPFYGRGDSAENSSAAGARIATAHTVNGMPWSGNEYLLDGVINNEPQNAYINITPPLEAIQEFKVQSSNPTAEFGVFGGAAVNLSIRSGTNDIHGSLFEYLRDDALNTRSYFAPTKAPYESNQFGFTFGGPLRKHRHPRRHRARPRRRRRTGRSPRREGRRRSKLTSQRLVHIHPEPLAQLRDLEVLESAHGPPTVRCRAAGSPALEHHLCRVDRPGMSLRAREQELVTAGEHLSSPSSSVCFSTSSPTLPNAAGHVPYPDLAATPPGTSRRPDHCYTR